MTDSVKGFVVTLEADARIDDAQQIVAAILRFRGVASVTPEILDVTDLMARERIRHEMRVKILDILWPADPRGPLP
jgi:hypothetical protein